MKNATATLTVMTKVMSCVLIARLKKESTRKSTVLMYAMDIMIVIKMWMEVIQMRRTVQTMSALKAKPPFNVTVQNNVFKYIIDAMDTTIARTSRMSVVVMITE